MFRLSTAAVLALALGVALAADTDNNTTTVSTTAEPITTTMTVTKPGNASNVTTTIAAQQNAENADQNTDAAKKAKGGKGKKGPKGPCADACIPKIDVKSSVIESYKRHRAQVAVIGDYGSCSVSSNNKYTWSVDWGDSEVHNRDLDAVGPYQSVHTYAKKGKYDIEVTFCSHLDGCDSGCTTMTKKLKVKP